LIFFLHPGDPTGRQSSIFSQSKFEFFVAQTAWILFSLFLKIPVIQIEEEFVGLPIFFGALW